MNCPERGERMDTVFPSKSPHLDILNVQIAILKSVKTVIISRQFFVDFFISKFLNMIIMQCSKMKKQLLLQHELNAVKYL